MSDAPRTTRRAVLAAGVMLGASLAAEYLRPKPTLVSPWGNTRLAAMVPTSFNDWSEVQSQPSTIVNPNLQEIVNTIYSDILSRTYVNREGEAVMLSLAYGQNQNRDLQVHKPEVCYVAQGFQLQLASKVQVATNFGSMPAMHLVARAGQRNEPITYWIRVGDQVIRGWFEQNLARVRQGIKGQLPDGLLVRVSSISKDTAAAFKLQERFLSDMLLALDPRYRAMFIGASKV